MTWIKCSERMPEAEQPVIWHNENAKDELAYWIGDYSDCGEGLVVTRSYHSPYFFFGAVWELDDTEYDDDYQPTHWHPLPELPDNN